MSASDHICETEKIAAFIDGDLEPVLSEAFEQHIQGCSYCRTELRAQRAFMCELDSALAAPFDLAFPSDFARVIAVRAECDMSGVRNPAEHRRALRFCIILVLAAFALLGMTSSEAAMLSVRSIALKVTGIIELFGKAVYDAVAGLIVILRVLSGGLIADSRLAGLTALVLIALVIGLLSLVISHHNRARLTE